MQKSKLSKGKVFELVWYSLQGLVALWGLVYIILGTVAHFVDRTSGLKVADANMSVIFGNGFLVLGIIILAIAVTLIVIVLLVFAKKTDRDYEKKQRRSARLQASKVETPLVDLTTDNSEVK